jgi:hypothetical protein
MKLDRVGRHSGLAVVEVPKGEPTTRAFEQTRTTLRASAICLRR